MSVSIRVTLSDFLILKTLLNKPISTGRIELVSNLIIQGANVNAIDPLGEILLIRRYPFK